MRPSPIPTTPHPHDRCDLVDLVTAARCTVTIQARGCLAALRCRHTIGASLIGWSVSGRKCVIHRIDGYHVMIASACEGQIDWGDTKKKMSGGDQRERQNERKEALPFASQQQSSQPYTGRQTGTGFWAAAEMVCAAI